MFIQQVLALSSLRQVSRSIITGSVGGILSALQGVLEAFVGEVGTTLGQMVESMHSESYAGWVVTLRCILFC